ncbi:MAG: hypothetical protein ABIX11_08770, partial [Casimicrobiaceae bacterium]
IRDADFRDAVAAIRAPTLVLSGAHDAATTPSDAAFLAGRISGARHVEIDGAHLSNFEKPDAFTGTLLDFLGGARVGGTLTPQALSA